MTEADHSHEKKDETLIQRCNKHDSFRHDFFISYRVFCDKVNSEKLASLLDGSTNISKDEPFKCYLDKNCLISGQSWEVGFSNGLRNSKTILIMISEGTIASLKSKAEKGEVDNVLKEHKMALELRKTKGVLVIPLYIANASKVKTTSRDSYVLLDHERSLRMFEDMGKGQQAYERLREVKQVLAEIFELPGIHIEPDSIAEKVPKILEMYYTEFVFKKRNQLDKLKDSVVYGVYRWVLHPTPSFRLKVVGTLFGFVPIFSLMLVFMPSKSKAHAALKKGICLGNIIAMLMLICTCAAIMYTSWSNSSGQYCTECESIVTASGDKDQELDSLYKSIPNIQLYIKACDSAEFNLTCSVAGYSPGCPSCLCAAVYAACVADQGYFTLFTFVISICIGFAVLAMVMMWLFKSMEAGSGLALQ